MSIKKKQIDLEAKLFKGLADQSRLLILQTLIPEPKTVSDIVKATRLSQPNTSAHLSCLSDCGLVQRDKQGREVVYRIASPEIKELIKSAQSILKKHAKEIAECSNY